MERKYTKFIRNYNMVYGFYTEGKKFGISAAVLLPKDEGWHWYIRDTIHTKACCLEIYKDLVINHGFHTMKPKAPVVTEPEPEVELPEMEIPEA